MAKHKDQQKELRHLSRAELIEIIYRQQLIVEDLQQRLADSKEKCGELTEQLRNVETSRSLSVRTEKLDADIQNMSRQLSALQDFIRSGAANGSSSSAQKSAFAAPRVPAPAVHPSLPENEQGPASPLTPPVPRRSTRPPVPEVPHNPGKQEQPAPTIASQLKGQPFRAK